MFRGFLVAALAAPVPEPSGTPPPCSGRAPPKRRRGSERPGTPCWGTVTDAERAAIDELVAYLASHSRRLNDRYRLACGEPIRSRPIKGRASR